MSKITHDGPAVPRQDAPLAERDGNRKGSLMKNEFEAERTTILDVPGKPGEGGWHPFQRDRAAGPRARPSERRARDRRISASAQELTRAWLRELRQ
jgi:hypothetical protein